MVALLLYGAYLILELRRKDNKENIISAPPGKDSRGGEIAVTEPLVVDKVPYKQIALNNLWVNKYTDSTSSEDGSTPIINLQLVGVLPPVVVREGCFFNLYSRSQSDRWRGPTSTNTPTPPGVTNTLTPTTVVSKSCNLSIIPSSVTIPDETDTSFSATVSGVTGRVRVSL